MAKCMSRSITTAIAAASLLGLTLAGCSAAPLSDRLPESMGGLPADAPARPLTPYQYPAVHDMPPQRSNAPLSETEQVRLERELRAVRDRQEIQAGTAKKSAAGDKKDAR